MKKRKDFTALGSINVNVHGVAQPKQLFTGLLVSGRDWTWKDGTNVDYTNWQINQPDGMNGQSCGSITTSNATSTWYDNWFIGGWDDVNCNYILNAICQMPANV
uniref:C-type lectin domain-containing protein n=1 Tax=Acrobeloides nanus TaxID=290746 RepID=A0A914DW14_9BILA